ncbi:MAG: toxin-antitoxin system HicB family antitoxin [Candidatus Tectomicrobia bacterium]|uniref:Toxin-antitoxin system HicB family antitoxin n=1 Tax=Tectimicrobiota bacterium TaxID=2528274 RepID=A0A932GPJ5_UNCTE|nr:toxin-antitoxin system HicB family antitoxin [Candidatus Tectomicrobia bacterium]
MSKDLGYYMKLDYPVTLKRCQEDGEVYFLAEISILPGCMSHGKTPNEAMEMIEGAKETWIRSFLEDGYEVPEPRDEEEYSGRFVVRIPKSLHKNLAEMARRENVSLNQLVVSLLSANATREAFNFQEAAGRDRWVRELVKNWLPSSCVVSQDPSGHFLLSIDPTSHSGGVETWDAQLTKPIPKLENPFFALQKIQAPYSTTEQFGETKHPEQV